jgi:hypothetical protein
MKHPEYLVVRIYRREPTDPTRIEGTVELVATGTQVPFANAHELWRILQHPPVTPEKARGDSRR